MKEAAAAAAKAMTPTAWQVTECRAQSGLSAEAFGALVYVGAPTVYAWEAGRRECQPASWELLLIYFGKAQPRTLKPAQRVTSAKVLRAVQTIQKAADSLNQ